jgi:hypothetical protein
MDDGDGRAISTSVEKKELGPKVVDYVRLPPGFEASLLQGSCESSETESGIF